MKIEKIIPFIIISCLSSCNTTNRSSSKYNNYNTQKEFGKIIVERNVNYTPTLSKKNNQKEERKKVYANSSYQNNIPIKYRASEKNQVVRELLKNNTQAYIQKASTLKNHLNKPNIVAKSAIVVDEETGEILYSKNSNVTRPVASIQKILTALVALNEGVDRKIITVNSHDVSIEPSKLGIRSGERYDGLQLLEAMLVKSGNDAARSIARNIAGSESNFAILMNSYAKSIGMYNSNFKNASGLTSSNQYSTAKDIAILARTAHSNLFIRNTVSKRRISFYYNRGGKITFNNTNKLLRYSPYCNGMKTGYTAASGRTLVSTGKYKGRNIIVVVLGSTSKSIWSDSKKLMHWSLGVPIDTA